MSTSPSTQVRTAVKAAIDAEFTAEGIAAENDKLDNSLGQGRPRAACYPEREAENARDANMLETEVIVQVWGSFDPQIDPEQKVDPAGIEAWAERLRERLKAYRGINNSACWYFNVIEVEYVDDPTGNKTRFTMRIQAYGNNTAAL